MSETTESPDLKEIRALLQKDNVPPEHAVEYFVPSQEVDALKQQIREATHGHCYFFSRSEDSRVHLIAIVNVENAADMFEKVKSEQSTATLASGQLAQGPAEETLEF